MARIVLGVFDNRSDTENAISKLDELGFDPKDISIMMKDKHQAEEISSDTGTNVAGGAVTGATTGGILGGLAGFLTGIGVIAIPGGLLIGGPIAAALGLTGAAATALSGAATGALAGGILGALLGLGIPEEDARVYEERLNAGAILLAVPAVGAEEDDVRSIMEDNNAQQIRTITTDWHSRSERATSEEYGTPAYFSQVGRKKH